MNHIGGFNYVMSQRVATYKYRDNLAKTENEQIMRKFFKTEESERIKSVALEIREFISFNQI